MTGKTKETEIICPVCEGHIYKEDEGSKIFEYIKNKILKHRNEKSRHEEEMKKKEKEISHLKSYIHGMQVSKDKKDSRIKELEEEIKRLRENERRNN